MIGCGRGGAPLLAGLAAGAVLVASAVLVAPPGAVPLAGLAALTDLAPRPPAAAPVTTTVPAPRPVPTLLPRSLPRPLDLLTPPTGTPPTSTPPPATTVAPEPTTPEPEPEPDPSATDGVVAATNAERLDAGCDALGVDPRLAAAAQGHSEDMAANDYFSHTGLDGSSFDERISAEGHPAPGGENIARGQENAEEVVAGWMASPGHRRNILDCGFVDIGVGLDPRGNYWTQEFGR